MAIVRSAFAHDDWTLAKEKLAVAKDLNEKGGDWDRRNRLKVYEGAFLLTQRDFSASSALLLDSIATFTASELYNYTHFIFLTVVACLRSLDRATLKKKVIDSPDVISCVHEVPFLQELLHSFYECRYADFLAALVGIYPAIAGDKVLSRHAPYYMREMRILAYTQFLESYKSITLAGMSKSFGVSPAFLDTELARFIAAGRINAKIDAVAGVVETTRPDAKNAQYHSVIKQGDHLLTKVQKLSRVVAV